MNKFMFILCFIVYLIFGASVCFAADDDILNDPLIVDVEANTEDDSVAPSEDYPVTVSQDDLVVATEDYSVSVSQDDLVQAPVDDPVAVSGETLCDNELLLDILNTNKEINENVKGIYQYLSNNCVSCNVLSDNMVSNNLINTPLSQYGLIESLLLFIDLLGISAGLVYIIHKSLYKWG